MSSFSQEGSGTNPSEANGPASPHQSLKATESSNPDPSSSDLSNSDLAPPLHLPMSVPPSALKADADTDLPDLWSYAETVQDIEAIVHEIESGELELTAVFEKFETAVEQLKQCETFLTEKQQHLDLLIETLVHDGPA